MQSLQSLRSSYTQSMVFRLQTQVAQHKRFWYLSHWRAATAHTSLRLFAVPPEPLPLIYTKYGIQATSTSWPAQEILVLIALASSDGSCEPKPSCSPSRAFASHIHKVRYSSYKHKLASSRDPGTYRIGEQRWLMRA